MHIDSVCDLLKSHSKSRNCESNQIVVNQISTLSNQILFSQIKSPHVIQS